MVVEKLKEWEDKRDEAQDARNEQAELINKQKLIDKDSHDPLFELVIRITWIDASWTPVVEWSIKSTEDEALNEDAADVAVEFLYNWWIKYAVALHKKLWADDIVIKKVLKNYKRTAEDLLDLF